MLWAKVEQPNALLGVAKMVRLSLTERSRLVASKDQVSCDLAGEAALLNLKSGVYFGLDPVGARIWRALQEPTSLGEIRAAILREYDVEPDRLDTDLRELVSDLAQHGLVEISE